MSGAVPAGESGQTGSEQRIRVVGGETPRGMVELPGGGLRYGRHFCCWYLMDGVAAHNLIVPLPISEKNGNNFLTCRCLPSGLAAPLEP